MVELEIETPEEESLTIPAPKSTTEKRYDFEGVLSDIVQALQGRSIIYVWDNKGRKIEILEGRPLMSEEALADYIAFLRSHFNQHLVFARLKEKDIQRAVYLLSKAILDWLKTKGIMYDIPIENWFQIYVITINLVYLNLKRALGGFESRMLASSIKEVISVRKELETEKERKKLPIPFPKII